MARSGSYNFSINRNEIINEAFRVIGTLGESQTASSTRITSAAQTLNIMIKGWHARGIGLWKNIEVVLFPQADQVKYRLGPTMQSSYGDYACLFTDYVKTEVATAAAAAATTIVVDSETGVTNGDFLGIETDNGDIHWSTQNGVPAGSGLTLTTGLDYAAAVDRHVYSGFSAIVQRPLGLVQAWRRDGDEIDTPIDIISIDEYRALTNKTNEAVPNSVALDLLLDDAVLYVWPEPNDMKTRIHLVVRYPFEDFDVSTDDPDFPIEWMEALIYNLAIRLAPQYSRKLEPEVMMIAQMAMVDLEGFDKEEASVMVKPHMSYRRFPSG
jgi:hypothetical protein